MEVTIGFLRDIGKRRGGQARFAIDTLADEVERQQDTITRLTRERDEIAGSCRQWEKQARNLEAALTRLCAHLPDGPDGTPNWEPTEPEEIAAMVERAERLLADAGDLEVMQAQASGWEEATARAEKAERERDDLRVDAEVLSDRLDSMREERDEAIAGLAWVTSDWTPVEDATCPVCGGMVKWSCGTGKYPHGRAECQDGQRVSRRWPGDGEPCAWHGAPTVRVRGSVRVKLTDNLGEFAEVRALADAYIDIVNRTARALGIPEVDEDGAMPSLHDVPERVGRLVAEVERLRPVERTPLERIARAKWAYRYERFGGDHRRVCYLSAEPLWAKITPRTDDSWKDCDWEIGGFGSTRSGFCAAGEYAAQRAVRKAFRDALADNEPTDDDATQDPPGWGGGEVSDG